MSELASGLLLGIESAFSGGHFGVGRVMTWVGTAILQGWMAQYGTQRVASVAQAYLREGSSWTAYGASTIKQMLVQHLTKTTTH